MNRFSSMVAAFALALSVAFGVSQTTLASNLTASETSDIAAAPSGAPVAISGSFAGVVEGNLAVQETGGAQMVAFPVSDLLMVTRDGELTVLNSLRPGDAVQMSVDASTGTVLRVDATPTPLPWYTPSNELALFAMLGLVAGAAALVIRNRRPAVLPRSSVDQDRDWLSLESARAVFNNQTAGGLTRLEARG